MIKLSQWCMGGEVINVLPDETITAQIFENTIHDFMWYLNIAHTEER